MSGPDVRIPEHYQGRQGNAYHEIVVEPWSVRSNEVNRGAFDAHVSADDVVIDFGCGSGRMLASLAAHRRIGIEVNKLAIQQASARGIEVVVSTRELADGLADVVISHHALEHTLMPFAELVEIRRLLKPRGKLVLMLPLDEWRKQRHPWHGDPDHHLYTWTPQLLSNLLDEAGFIVQECRVFTRAPFPRRLAPWRASLGRLWLPSGAAYVYAVVRRLRQLYAVACALPDSAGP